MEPSSSEALTENKEGLSNSSEDLSSYPLEPKPGISCIPHQYESPSSVRLHSLTIINPNVSVRLEVIYKRDSERPAKT